MPSDRPANPTDDRPRGDALSIGALLRLAADDELTADEADRLERHLREHPEDRARIDSERGLRAHVARFGARAPAASSDLRERIAGILAGEAEEADAPVIRRTDRSFWQRSLAPLAIAASLLLVVSASLVIRQAAVTTGGGWMNEVFGAEVAGFVDREHDRCVELDDATNLKFVTSTLEGASELMVERLGSAPAMIDLSVRGLTLAGAGGCHVPGDGRSVHLLYRPTSEAGTPVSLFVQREVSGFEGADSNSLCIQRPRDERDEVLVWRRDGLIYYLVCPPGRDARELLTTLGAPTERTFL